MEREPVAQHRGSRGFTLIEMIGVMAIMAVLAAVLVPAGIRTLDLAAIRAEAKTLQALSEHAKQHLREIGSAPTGAAWSTEIAAYADASPGQVAINRKGVPRVYITDPTSSPTPRAIILSAMRRDAAFNDPALNLPPATAINAARFDVLWAASDIELPNWNGWWGGSVAWSAGTVEDQRRRREYLLIERINFTPILREAEFQSKSIALNNRENTAVSYTIFFASTGTSSAQILQATTSTTLTVRLRDRVEFYRGAGIVDYTYTVSAAAPPSFKFEGGRWSTE